MQKEAKPMSLTASNPLRRAENALVLEGLNNLVLATKLVVV